MAYTQLKIHGFRGFSEEQTLNIAVPNGREGSGLTVIVGPNNSGKSTIFESLRAINLHDAPSITEGRRNKAAGDKIKISIIREDGTSISLQTKSIGGSETEFISNGLPRGLSFFTLPSRRTFAPFFGKGTNNRDSYTRNSPLTATRGSSLDNFASRLFTIQSAPDEFNRVLRKILPEIPEWYIEQADNGQHYLKFNNYGQFHNSDGVGEGLLSIFTIADALYDSVPGGVIVIDEPELSIHPAFQRKLMRVLAEYSTDRQIIIATHSPFFISWNSLMQGGQIVRTTKENGVIKIYQPSPKTIADIGKLISNLNNPHILGLDAKEIFFLDDKIILLEGQEDVIFIQRICALLGITHEGTFFGWGLGGADNAEKILALLNDLGFKKVTTIFDLNKRALILPLAKKFPNYQFLHLPTDDIRDKAEIKSKEAIKGIIDQGGKTVDPTHTESVGKLFEEVDAYFKK